MQQAQCKCLHAQQPCKNLAAYMHSSFLRHFFICHHSVNATNCSKYCNEIADYNENLQYTRSFNFSEI